MIRFAVALAMLSISPAAFATSAVPTEELNVIGFDRKTGHAVVHGRVHGGADGCTTHYYQLRSISGKRVRHVQTFQNCDGKAPGRAAAVAKRKFLKSVRLVRATTLKLRKVNLPKTHLTTNLDRDTRLRGSGYTIDHRDRGQIPHGEVDRDKAKVGKLVRRITVTTKRLGRRVFVLNKPLKPVPTTNRGLNVGFYVPALISAHIAKDRTMMVLRYRARKLDDMGGPATGDSLEYIDLRDHPLRSKRLSRCVREDTHYNCGNDVIPIVEAGQLLSTPKPYLKKLVALNGFTSVAGCVFAFRSAPSHVNQPPGPASLPLTLRRKGKLVKCSRRECRRKRCASFDDTQQVIVGVLQNSNYPMVFELK